MFEYTEDQPLQLKEYGRNVQKMVTYAITLPTKEQRNLAAKEIIKVMMGVSPAVRDTTEQYSKLWVHLLQISNYQLDIDVPFELPERKEPSYSKKHQRLPYPKQSAYKFKQYGRLVEMMIKETIMVEDEALKATQIAVIANVMKLNHRQWSKDHVLSDAVIAQHVYEISGGRLDIREQEIDMNRFVDKAKEQEKFDKNKKWKKTKFNKNGFKKKKKFPRP